MKRTRTKESIALRQTIREQRIALRRQAWKAALERHNGNVSATAAEFGVHKQRGYDVCHETGLTQYAHELREKARQDGLPIYSEREEKAVGSNGKSSNEKKAS